ncbi:uncharacterized protein HHUB_1441 [Halobacterium hubeiense]|uniref:Uncharacterized protein n=1 Tax=Halobacterium hubeiense TaxID=1407499 RepID=A0A0U5H0F1_9EURY|nr:uncharacterized protein HHUB_1441 [Halobacterium hubeiense]
MGLYTLYRIMAPWANLPPTSASSPRIIAGARRVAAAAFVAWFPVRF